MSEAWIETPVEMGLSLPGRPRSPRSMSEAWIETSRARATGRASGSPRSMSEAWIETRLPSPMWIDISRSPRSMSEAWIETRRQVERLESELIEFASLYE